LQRTVEDVGEVPIMNRTKMGLEAGMNWKRKICLDIQYGCGQKIWSLLKVSSSRPSFFFNRTGIYIDVIPFKEAFKVYFDSGVNELHEKLSLLRAADARNVRNSLALLALRDQRADILKYCLDQGFNWNGCFVDAANNFERTNEHTEITKILHDSKFRQDWPWPIHKRQKIEGEESGPAEDFDYGGEYEVNW
jgi:hypothetical protein